MARASFVMAIALLAACVPSSRRAARGTLEPARVPDEPARPARPAPVRLSSAAVLGSSAEMELRDYLRARRLVVPVAGVSVDRIPDSFDHPRGTDGSRRHNAIDIMAPRGTPVLAADDGQVLKLRRNAAGGITIYATDPSERVIYYYAHLDRYRRGLREGTKLAKGDTIGFVGSTGNAPKNIPHLHFQITRMPADRRWWGGEPIDPLPLLMEAEEIRE